MAKTLRVGRSEAFLGCKLLKFGACALLRLVQSAQLVFKIGMHKLGLFGVGSWKWTSSEQRQIIMEAVYHFGCNYQPSALHHGTL